MSVLRSESAEGECFAIVEETAVQVRKRRSREAKAVPARNLPTLQDLAALPVNRAAKEVIRVLRPLSYSERQDALRMAWRALEAMR